MDPSSTVEIHNFRLDFQLGESDKIDNEPYTHLLDLVLTVSPQYILIDTDTMDQVSDYDPLLNAIRALTTGNRFETQEFVVTCIIAICAAFEKIQALEIFLRKKSELLETTSLGVRVSMNRATINGLAQHEVLQAQLPTTSPASSELRQT
jgi:dihydroneopterin aldolase